MRRLTQLVEQTGWYTWVMNRYDAIILTALQASQSSFQPSLDALQDVPGDDTVDLYSEVFDIDVDHLADSISKLPMYKRLDIDSVYFEVRKTTQIGYFDTAIQDEGSYTHSTVIIEDKPPPVINRDIIAAVLTTEKSSKISFNKQEEIQSLSKINTPIPVTNSVAVEEDEMLTQLLAAKTEDVGTKHSGVKMTNYTVKSLSQTDATDEENDSLLEELLAQPV